MRQTRITATLLVLLVLAAAVPAPALATDSTQSQDCTFPVTVTDAKGTEVTIESAPQAIVSLNPSAAQTLWAVGAKDKVVGISEYATYLDGADQKTIVNTASGGINVEQTIALEPDLVLAPGTIPNETIDNLRSKGLTVVAFDTPTSVDGVATKTTQIGRITGHCTGAAETNDWMRTNIETIESAVAETDHPRAMYVFYGYTVGANTFIHDAMQRAGLTNIMAQAGSSGYGQVNKEIVRERNPEWFIVNSDDPGIPSDPAYNETIAVQQNQTVTVPVHYMNQPAPRSVVEAVHRMATSVHPDATEDVEIQPRNEFQITTTTTTATSTSTATTDAQTTTTTTTGTQTPGFGVAVGLVGLLAAFLLARR